MLNADFGKALSCKASLHRALLDPVMLLIGNLNTCIHYGVLLSKTIFIEAYRVIYNSLSQKIALIKRKKIQFFF